MKLLLPLALLPAVALSPAPETAAPAADDAVTLDFEDDELPAGWRLSSKKWRIAEGELRGTGSGYLEYSVPQQGAFTLTFDAWTEEKANVEVKLFHADREEELFTFAFLGSYHSVLDGPKSCMLQGNRFVHVDSRTWIFPGRFFEFEVRSARNQYQMFLNQELGPFWVDENPPEEEPSWRLRILFGPETERDSVRIDDVRFVPGKQSRR